MVTLLSRVVPKAMLSKLKVGMAHLLPRCRDVGGKTATGSVQLSRSTPSIYPREISYSIYLIIYSFFAIPERNCDLQDERRGGKTTLAHRNPTVRQNGRCPTLGPVALT